MVRTKLSKVPANRIKIYGDLPLDEVLNRAQSEKRPLLSPLTQKDYLDALRDVLTLGKNKRLLPGNPAEGLKPVKRDTVAAADKRRPFTVDQIVRFFGSDFYRKCSETPKPYAADPKGWRFWLPPMCLFLGLRPNEAAQLRTDDVRQTGKGTWYLDITASSEDDDEEGLHPKKTLKTATSYRKIPIHPELIEMGFLQFISEQRQKGDGVRVFPDLNVNRRWIGTPYRHPKGTPLSDEFGR